MRFYTWILKLLLKRLTREIVLKEVMNHYFPNQIITLFASKEDLSQDFQAAMNQLNDEKLADEDADLLKDEEPPKILLN